MGEPVQSMGAPFQWFGIVFLVIASLGGLYCLVGVFNPRTVWYWQEGWKYRNTTMVEPSDARLLGIRIGSVLGFLVSVAFVIGASLVLLGTVRIADYLKT